MRWYKVFFTFLLIAGCGRTDREPIAPIQSSSYQQSGQGAPPQMSVSYAGSAHPLVNVLLRSSEYDSLAPILGWQDFGQSYVVEAGQGRALLVIPLEAEDEIRALMVIFRGRHMVAMAAVGLAEINAFDPVRADTALFEGWMFAYDLASGFRTISSYRESGCLVTQDEFRMPNPPLAVDILSCSVRRECVARTLSAPPLGLRSSIFLARSWEERVRQMTPLLDDILACEALDTHRPRA